MCVMTFVSEGEWLGSPTCDQQVVGSNPGRRAAECNPGQVVYTFVPRCAAMKKRLCTFCHKTKMQWTCMHKVLINVLYSHVYHDRSSLITLLGNQRLNQTSICLLSRLLERDTIAFPDAKNKQCQKTYKEKHRQKQKMEKTRSTGVDIHPVVCKVLG